MRANGLPDVIRAAGLAVQVMDGYGTRGDELDAINGLVWHHSGSSPAWDIDDLLRLLRDGREDLSGPLYQAGVDRDGTWHLIASGRANHAGAGQWPGLAGNPDTLGLCAFHRGTDGERWQSAQVSSWRVGTAAVARFYEIDPSRFLIGHKEWAPRRKVDPYALHMPNERRNVAALMMEDDMPLTDDDIDRIFARVWGTKVGRSDYTFAQALDRTYRTVTALGDDRVDVDALAAALSDQLGADLAAELGRRLQS